LAGRGEFVIHVIFSIVPPSLLLMSFVLLCINLSIFTVVFDLFSRWRFPDFLLPHLGNSYRKAPTSPCAVVVLVDTGRLASHTNLGEGYRIFSTSFRFPPPPLSFFELKRPGRGTLEGVYETGLFSPMPTCSFRRWTALRLRVPIHTSQLARGCRHTCPPRFFQTLSTAHEVIATEGFVEELEVLADMRFPKPFN